MQYQVRSIISIWQRLNATIATGENGSVRKDHEEFGRRVAFVHQNLQFVADATLIGGVPTYFGA